MCGIVGYLGPEDPKDVIINGLKALEYRGYDSAGVAILDGDQFKRVRAQGKLTNLKEKLKTQVFSGHLGIGHTRWATHGAPSERNAHPHCVKGISIVHNGIIENYQELRDELPNAEFQSDTDSELVAHLISKEVDAGEDLYSAVLKILPQLTGAYSILAVSSDQPDEMVAFKNGPPLIVGQTPDSVIVASDVQAMVKYTKNVYYLEDDQVAHIKGHEFRLTDRTGRPLEKTLTVVDWSPEQAEKQGYPHFMLKEIFEQPRAVAAALEPHVNTETHSVNLNDVGFGKDTTAVLAGVERVFVVACGTSYYAGMVGEYYVERLAGIPVEVDIASEFRYRHPVIPKNSLVVFISQSGETADTLAALRQVKSEGVTTLSICNVKRSSIDREADGHLYMNAGIEIGVASTKAFVASLTLMNLLALAIAKSKGQLGLGLEKELVQDLLGAPSQMETVLAYDKFFNEAAETLKGYRGFLYMGRGANYPVAMEGALKLKELAYMHAEGYAAGEMKHGPLALIDETMAIIMLAPSDDLYEKTVSNLEEAKARGGVIISIGTGDNDKLKGLSAHYLALPPAHWTINPLLEVIPLQLLAYHVADAMGRDVDQPRNLAKSVTVE
ncbi:MAG: glutamine--fructose-6-phosphate transaminase (isomerizing) [Pseudobdellovibrionaceae bacterium]|nr:glutamine--fructose-6-phosphate transaminase (isomerizing) [Bdellovibrionales bacterium]USN47263.1 MAG: glutamine--fructose-6-phosphate transaminase (isomerizing) [Pseudobdellovibrionaceae bacterium]